MHVKVPRRKEVLGSDDSTMVPGKKIRAEREVKALFPARQYPMSHSHSSTSARESGSLKLDVKTWRTDEGRQGVKQQLQSTLSPPFLPSSSSSFSSTALPPSFVVLPSSTSTSSSFSILSKAPLLSSVSSHKPLTAVSTDSIDGSSFHYINAPQQSQSSHCALISDPTHSMSIEELDDIVGDGEGMGLNIDGEMDIDMNMEMDFNEDLSLFNSDEHIDMISDNVGAEGVLQHAPSSSSFQKTHPSNPSTALSSTSTSTLKSRDDSKSRSQSRSPPNSYSPYASYTQLPPLASPMPLPSHASAERTVSVSGGLPPHLHRAKPGPKPRLQFTSDGEKSSVCPNYLSACV